MTRDSEQNSSNVSRFLPNPHIAWAIEIDSVILINHENDKTLTLKYPQAMIWDFLTRGYTNDRIVPLVSIIYSCNENESLDILNKTLNDWLKAGLISVGNNHG